MKSNVNLRAFCLGIAILIFVSGCGASFLAEADTVYESGDYKSAVGAYRAALKEHPESAQGHYMLGKSLLELNRRKEATTAFKKAYELKPSHSGARTELSFLYIKDGDSYLKRKDYNEAVSAYKKADDLSKSNPETALKLAQAYAGAGYLNLAGKNYDEALKRGEEKAETEAGKKDIGERRKRAAGSFDKGKSAYDKGSLKTAKKHLDKAIAINKDDLEINYLSHIVNGRVLYKQAGNNRLWDALVEFGEAAQIKGKSAEPHYFLGLGYLKKDDKDFENFISEFEKALELEPNGIYAGKIKKELARQRKRKKTLDEFWGK